MALSVAAIIILTVKLRVHAFLTLIFVSVLMAVALGLPLDGIPKDVIEGFGGTLGYVGIITFLATIIGELLVRTGATVVISESILKLVGRSRSAIAVGAAGFLVAPPVACNDTAFLILSPVAAGLGNAAGYSTALISLALAAGAYSSFKLIFPGAPLYAALIFQANLAEVILLGLLLAVPVFAVGLAWTRAYSRYVASSSGRSHSSSGTELPLIQRERLPSALGSYATITIPLTLILGRAFAEGYVSNADGARTLIDFLGHPVVAMLVGVSLALVLARSWPRHEVSKWVGDGLVRATAIVAIVGAGGVLGRILIDADMGNILGSSIAGIGVSGAAAVFLVAAIIKTAQGSSVVTMVTAPSILLPILPMLGVSPTLATLLVSAGAMISVHVNDSYFWVVTGFSQMSISEGIRSLTAMSVLQGLTAFALIIGITAVLPGL